MIIYQFAKDHKIEIEKTALGNYSVSFFERWANKWNRLGTETWNNINDIMTEYGAEFFQASVARSENFTMNGLIYKYAKKHCMPSRQHCGMEIIDWHGEERKGAFYTVEHDGLNDLVTVYLECI